MSAPRKLRPAPDSELRKLKGLPADARAEIYAWKDEASATNAALRERIAGRFGVRLTRDDQLSSFWSWQFGQAALDSLGEMMSSDEQQLADKFPHLTRDQIRDATIKRSYAIAALIQEEHPGFGLKVVSADLKDKDSTFEQAKYAEALKSKLKAGLDAVAEAFKAHPESMKLYQQARAMIERQVR
jgi:hypothetical protein